MRRVVALTLLLAGCATGPQATPEQKAQMQELVQRHNQQVIACRSERTRTAAAICANTKADPMVEPYVAAAGLSDIFAYRRAKRLEIAGRADRREITMDQYNVEMQRVAMETGSEMQKRVAQ